MLEDYISSRQNKNAVVWILSNVENNVNFIVNYWLTIVVYHIIFVNSKLRINIWLQKLHYLYLCVSVQIIEGMIMRLRCTHGDDLSIHVLQLYIIHINCCYVDKYMRNIIDFLYVFFYSWKFVQFFVLFMLYARNWHIFCYVL